MKKIREIKAERRKENDERRKIKKKEKIGK